MDRSDVRGELVQLDAAWQSLLKSTRYPEPVKRLLGEAVAATALMAETIKFDGNLTLQAQGDGPVKLLVVQVTSERTFRATAKCDETVEAGSLSEMIGKGQMVITVEQGESRSDYQGVVPLEGERLQEALAAYFERSEQLSTGMWLAANTDRAAGLMLQKLPESQVSSDDDLWSRVKQLADTVKADELLTLGGTEVLHRLFHEEEVRVFEGVEYQFRCNCSRNRIANTIYSLGEDDAQALVAERGSIEVDCQFCHQQYRFDAVDVTQLFASDSASSSDQVH
ncbi:chaperonin HslO [gamma proteobacterium HTCC5015]|nr:chaperonin HslO [gamma proteobacterium HTCC5015]